MRLVAGVVVLVLGVVTVGYGIGQAIGQAGAIEDDAVATGAVRLGEPESIPFESTEPSLSVYMDFGGITNNSVVYERAAAATTCRVTAQDGRVKDFSGSRQGTAATIGSYVSTPHKTSEVAISVLIILAGVGVGLIGAWLAVSGWLRRRDRARRAGLPPAGPPR